MMNPIEQVANNVAKWDYVSTSQYNSKQVGHGRQMFTVETAALVPSDWNGDKNIIGVAALVGKRGAQKFAYIYSNGRISVVY